MASLTYHIDAAQYVAALRLHAKGLITQPDGGYLTRLGREAAERAQAMLGILTAGVAASVTSPSPPET